MIFVHLQHAETADVRTRFHILAYNRHIGAFLDMILQNLVVIHFIFVVAECDHHIWFMAALKEIQVLIDGIRGTSVPPAVIRSNRGSKHIKSSLFSSEVPPFGGTQMLI